MPRVTCAGCPAPSLQDALRPSTSKKGAHLRNPVSSCTPAPKKESAFSVCNLHFNTKPGDAQAWQVWETLLGRLVIGGQKYPAVGGWRLSPLSLPLPDSSTARHRHTTGPRESLSSFWLAMDGQRSGLTCSSLGRPGDTECPLWKQPLQKRESLFFL